MRKTALFVVLLALCLPEARAERITTPSFSEFVAKATVLGRELGNSNVLLVYDLDNTLLAMDQPLGSDQWFSWQEGLLRTGSSRFRAASDFSGLLLAQGVLYGLSHMHPPEAEEPAGVMALEKQGFASLVLSSRGPEFRDATQRELQRNGYDFSHGGFTPEAGYPGTFLPYTTTSPSDTSLNADEISSLGLGAPRPVSFENGVYLGSGQHKGALLLSLLRKTSHWYKAILFIDDQVIHHERMEKVFHDRATHLVGFRYSREDAKVAAFASADKAPVARDWDTLRTAVSHTLPTGLFPQARGVAAH